MRKVILLTILTLLILGMTASAEAVDLSKAKIVVLDPKSKIQSNAADMLRDEIEKRTRITLEVTTGKVTEPAPVIVIGVGKAVTKKYPPSMGLKMPTKADGYAIWFASRKDPFPTICLAGVDERGALFAAGKLLRLLDMRRDKLSLDGNTNLASEPDIALRGHQLGYRAKTNSYDAWDAAMWEQYYREMAVFGMNAVELIPPISDDDDDSPHLPKPQLEMMVIMSQLAEDYGMDLWIWYPALDKRNGKKIDYSDQKTVEAALVEWGEVFAALPKIDVVFVPGGDPGNTNPTILMPFIEKQKKNLNKYHPKAQMWVSPQGFDRKGKNRDGWLKAWLDIMQNDQPAWLDGVVFGPQVEMSLPDLRKALPAKYPIRRYPDITHCRSSQYAVPDWDPVWKGTIGREPVNPRPIAYTKIFRDLYKYSMGFITYSEGCNDDFNKVLWSCLGWDTEMDPMDIAKEYAKFFINPKFTDKYAQGLFDLEQNWKGSLLENDQPYKTLKLFQQMEKRATPQNKLNWRFQQGLYRAYYDAYIKARLHYETDLEAQAKAVLKTAPQIGADKAMDQAEAILDKGVTEKTKPQWRARTFELAEALYQSIHMQLSVERYQAIRISRGANLDEIDKPFYDREDMIENFNRIRKMKSEDQKIQALKNMAN